MSVANYLKLQRQFYSELTKTRADAERAVHPRYEEARRSAYIAATYLLREYRDRTATDLDGVGGDFSAIGERFAEIPRSLRILDYGCGVGRVMEPLAENGFAPDGVDISPEMLKYAGESQVLQKAGSKLFSTRGDNCGDAPKDTYDLAFSLLCLQHICVRSVRMGILRSLREALNPQGVAIVQMLYFPGVNTAGIPPQHANWMDDRTDIGGTNSMHDVWVTQDQSPQVMSDFGMIYKDVRMQIVELNGARIPCGRGQTYPFHHLFLSGSKTALYRERMFRPVKEVGKGKQAA